MGYLGVINSCEGIGTPLTVKAQICGYGEKEDLAKEMLREVVDALDAAGYESMYFAAAGMANANGATYASDDQANDPETIAHEEWHVELARGHYTDNQELTNILNESSAHAVGLYNAREVYRESGDKEKLAKIEKQIENSKEYSAHMLETYTLVKEAEEKGEDLEKLRSKVWKAAHETRWGYNRKNWTSLLVDMSYFGAFGPAFDVLEEHGLERGKDILKEAFESTNESADITAGKDHLLEYLSEEERERYDGELDIVESKAPNRFYISGEDFNIGLWTEDERAVHIIEEVYEKYRDRFESKDKVIPFPVQAVNDELLDASEVRKAA